ncbi:MAG: IclR family transcriptional regulator [Phascolarctobacterium sp.]|nr:IclR family transcriptional regulator [Phascolarctobacterium sp.]
MPNNSPKLIQSVQRAIDILNCFNNTKPELNINEISAHTKLNVNTARGLINTLVANGLLMYDSDTAIYRLGNFFLTKAGILQAQIRSYILMCKHLVNDLAEKYHLTASLQIVNQDEIVTLYCAYPVSTSYYITLSEYTPLPIYATSSGKLLLAHTLLPERPEIINELKFHSYTPYTINTKEQLLDQLEQVTLQGYSLELEEFNMDVGSIAVPVFNYNQELVATVSCTFFAKSLPDIKCDLVKELMTIGEEIARNIGTNH